VGYFANDGSLQILGRRDHQLKIRGHRIEPGAVETALMRLPKIATACVIGRRDDHGAAWLEAFVVPADGTADEVGPHLTLHPEITELRQQLAAVLPPHLIPSRIWQCLPNSEGEGLPKTAAGKIDRRRLESLSSAEEAGLNGSRASHSPLDANERRLAAIWGKLLEVEELHLHPESNFFALGGHSFLATRLVQWLRQSYRLDVPLLDIFTHPTLAEMAHRLKLLTVEGRTIPAPRP
jgi:aryl carrier-like protein